jgi:hypothetical protein
MIERTDAAFVDKSAHDLGERAERDLRARLGPDRWARAYAAGRGASIDSLLQDIRTPARHLPGPLVHRGAARQLIEDLNLASP